MSKKPPGNVTELAARHSPCACRVAYTLGNRQPVQCTIIGDEPLFFMDYEEDFSEDTLFEETFEFDAIEQGIAALQEKILGMEKASSAFDSPTAGLFEGFLENARFITHGADDAGDEPAIDDLKITLRQSRLGAAYMDFALRFKTAMVYSRETQTALYDRNANMIYINPDCGPGERLLLAARELRRLWQHRNGALLHPLLFHPDQAILVNRAQIADLSVSMVRIAWELQLAGDMTAWMRLENSSMADLASAFARESALDFRTLNNGMAASAVFETWFLSDRCRHEDRRLIQHMLADYHGYVFEPGEPARGVTAELIGALGSVPFGKNYLAPFVGTITGDAIFTEVRDRSNANFLWFIKFERSFRETEQGLHGDKSVRSRDLTSGETNISNGRIGHNEKTADIIALPCGGTAALPAAGRTERGAKQRAGGGGVPPNVVSFLPPGNKR